MGPTGPAGAGRRRRADRGTGVCGRSPAVGRRRRYCVKASSHPWVGWDRWAPNRTSRTGRFPAGRPRAAGVLCRAAGPEGLSRRSAPGSATSAPPAPYGCSRPRPEGSRSVLPPDGPRRNRSRRVAASPRFQAPRRGREPPVRLVHGWPKTIAGHITANSESEVCSPGWVPVPCLEHSPHGTTLHAARAHRERQVHELALGHAALMSSRGPGAAGSPRGERDSRPRSTSAERFARARSRPRPA